MNVEAMKDDAPCLSKPATSKGASCEAEHDASPTGRAGLVVVPEIGFFIFFHFKLVLPFVQYAA